MKNKMIDKKGRIFGKLNIIDAVVLLILIAGIYIALQFIFFKPNFFTYKNVSINVSFKNVPLNDLVNLSKGKTYLYDDNSSYLIIPEKTQINCSEKYGIWVVYYFNDSHFMFNGILTIYETKDNNSYVIYKTIRQYVDKPDYLYIKNYFCSVGLLFKVKARIINEKSFYEKGWYQLEKNNHFNVRINDIELKNGKITEVYRASDERGKINE